MPIKHLVIAGGGPIGLQFLGALEHLNEQNFWKLEDIESIYATSIGTFIAAFICLKYDWETINTYIIERPWHDVFKLNGKQIFDAFYNKGLFDKKVIEITFKPLLEAKDLSLNITLKEFYEYSKIEFHLYAFELNKFEVVDISYKTHPDLLLVQAIFMSSALPGVFIPTILDSGCYIDGGVMANYPLSYCLQDHENSDEILGVTFYRDYLKPDAYKNNIVTEESSVIDFSIGFFINAMNYIYKTLKNVTIKNQVECINDDRFLTMEVIQKSLNSVDMRRDWINKGINDAKIFLEKINPHSEDNKTNKINNIL
jgi:predicted acylesterase/phospholipase RssA